MMWKTVAKVNQAHTHTLTKCLSNNWRLFLLFLHGLRRSQRYKSSFKRGVSGLILYRHQQRQQKRQQTPNCFGPFLAYNTHSPFSPLLLLELHLCHRLLVIPVWLHFHSLPNCCYFRHKIYKQQHIFWPAKMSTRSQLTKDLNGE